ncbi:helix-turn-helix domain-containing protein [Singulisphaera acidiphila]|uniref:DNA-binding protein, excisionase family n=1 Tax=Singulisphaera acidiphila (strain ATCC BAA-1392 / DSM 18658 / VKM B-2454 / MOB10) TaxID=886293 RepID=L0DFN2_SINAD|nr:helix-turn-helix domain-containing protein [Singulisphaera acidiphila]AGA28184.1 DNA-binding protein, excisionase family [Singulisphaera acidiphila DSM 18658]
MSVLRATRPALRRPTESESRMALESSRRLGAVVADLDQPGEDGSGQGGAEVVVQVKGQGASESLTIPLSALTLLRMILEEMAQGNAITITPVHAELTTQEGADLLHVSRPFLIKLLEGGEIPYRTVGRHRRVRFDDLMAYKQHTDVARAKVLDELVSQAQELDMGY